MRAPIKYNVCRHNKFLIKSSIKCLKIACIYVLVCMYVSTHVCAYVQKARRGVGIIPFIYKLNTLFNQIIPSAHTHDTMRIHKNSKREIDDWRESLADHLMSLPRGRLTACQKLPTEGICHYDTVIKCTRQFIKQISSWECLHFASALIIIARKRIWRFSPL